MVAAFQALFDSITFRRSALAASRSSSVMSAARFFSGPLPVPLAAQRSRWPWAAASVHIARDQHLHRRLPRRLTILPSVAGRPRRLVVLVVLVVVVVGDGVSVSVAWSGLRQAVVT